MCVGTWAQGHVHMRYSVMSFVAPQSPPNLLTLSHKRCDFQQKVTVHKMCVLIFSTTFVQNISHSNKKLARYCHTCENVFM